MVIDRVFLIINIINCFNKFISKLDTFKPREYVLENLSMEVCEKKMINIIKNE